MKFSHRFRKKCNKKGYVAIKLDMEKAYNKLIVILFASALLTLDFVTDVTGLCNHNHNNL